MLRRQPHAEAGLVLGLGGLAVAVTGITFQMLPRRFTATQQREIVAWEIAKRWRALPAATIFPATVSYHLPGYALDGSQTLSLRARRLGVAAAGPCASGAGPAAALILRRSGCIALLRATYADSTGSLVATVGVAVLPGDSAAVAVQAKLAAAGPRDLPGSVRPAPVTGTLAARFDLAQRQLSWNTHVGPYVILTTLGYADGRPRVRVAADYYLSEEMTSLDQGLGRAVAGVLGRTPPAPTCPGAPGC
jgi:hypothetical protein